MQSVRIGLLAAVALLALAGSHFVRAQGNHPDFLWLPTSTASSVGVTTGQLLRLTAFNPSPARSAHARFTIFAPDGTPVGAAGPVAVGPLQTASFDLSGDDRTLDSFREASGRVQLSIRVDFQGHRGATVSAPGTPQDPILVAGGEVVEEATGRTTASITMKGSKILQN